ncbi:hypothetical protein TNCV_2095101 [Trichonephila clavipes]|nr:hypothetical protein TNCV_2095101 [Trichonephila clavipes]
MCCCSVVRGKASNEAATESSNFCSVASEPGVMDLSEPRLKVLGGLEDPYLKKVCCMLWTKIPIPVHEELPLQPEHLEQLSLVYCKTKPYIHFMHR